MKYTIPFFLFLFTFIACKTEKSSTPVVQEKLPPVPEQFIIDMYEKIDHIDYYFRNTAFSVSQDQKESVQQFISLLSSGEARMVSETCPSPLRMTFLSLGEIIFETEMYMSENCMYVEYYIDNKKTYQSAHSQEGYNFLMNIIKSAENAR